MGRRSLAAGHGVRQMCWRIYGPTRNTRSTPGFRLLLLSAAAIGKRRQKLKGHDAGTIQR
jgi:hypothetical protein